MYDKVTYDPKTHLLEMGDVGLMSMYVADCDALAKIAEILDKKEETKELQDRSVVGGELPEKTARESGCARERAFRR